jgi:hypothetical protein
MMLTMETDACKSLSNGVPKGIEKEFPKVVFIGDIHGRTIWKKILDLEPDADRYIFFGDYFDPYEPIPFEVQAQNFRDIINLKAQLGERVVLLVGNHDYHYYADVRPYSRYDFGNAGTIKSLLKVNMDALQIAYQFGSILCSHAGVSATWLDIWFPEGWMWQGIDKKINSLHDEKPEAFDYYEGDMSGCGDDERQGPLWIRPSALSDGVFVQFIGHTMRPKLNSRNTRRYLVDHLWRNAFVKLQNGHVESFEIEN